MNFAKLLVAAAALALPLAASTPASAITKATCEALGGFMVRDGVCVVVLSLATTGSSWKIPQPWQSCFDSGKAILRSGRSYSCATVAGVVEPKDESVGTPSRLCPPTCPKADAESGAPLPAKRTKTPGTAVTRPENTPHN